MNISYVDKLADYENILVVDEKGHTLFYDIPDLNVLRHLGQRPEDFLGRKVTTFYKDLSEQDSTVMTVLRTRQPLTDIRQVMTTHKGGKVESISSTYPIIESGEVKGAIEFSKRFYSKKNIESLNKYAGHKMYRKNNTIYTIGDMITKDPAMEKIKQKIRKISRTDSTLMISGKTGTGKEIVAQSVHNLSDRFGGPFISLNCSAVPENLMETTLFGTTKGSFTGAEETPGLFEQADGGTLFLDEINSLDITLQVKLLKAVEEKSVRRIGGKKNIPVDIRVISATNEDPETLLSEQRLREDLFYRMAVVEIRLPELKERKEDIKILLDYYLNFYNDKMNITIEEVDQEVIDCFMRYKWPGNVREFKNAIEMAYNHAENGKLALDDIPERICKKSSKEASPITNDSVSLKDAVENFEKELIIEHYTAAEEVIAETARRLGISKQSLKYKINKYNLR
ncbi:sigma-54 interaction domain-containing protein [Thalassobacillus devorans]|uniref:sigma-54 interaction domain-containing protein n=1 Tax=Thalassobacillus devorans TaxID=279813 RepID=UPI0006852D78|nr:sigma 54-interacting transcriptional regulator [Thalassobacillus devorans]